MFFFEQILLWGLAAGLLQAIGYVLYIRNQDIDPNPVTWFMFAYGTAILTVLEWDTGASWALLALPAVCALLSIYVSFRCWKQARLRDPSKWWPEDWWPEDRTEQLSFVSDMLITIAYIAAWGLAASALLSETYRTFAALSFLFLSNLSTFPAFYPLLRETWLDPTKEHWLPWAVWSLAYGALLIATLLETGTFWHSHVFYPASNLFLHALVGIVALRTLSKNNTIPTTSITTR